MSISSLRSTGKLSLRATGVYAAVAAMTFSASSSAPTPLYRVYQETMHLTPPVVTFIFAVYVLGMLASFLTLGRLSDYVGRRPMILGALVANLGALAIFFGAEDALHLAAARLLQGVATGVALTSLGATIVDTNPRASATLNSVTAFLGLSVGSLLTGALMEWAPHPTQFVYGVLLSVTFLEILVLTIAPETTVGKPGALRTLAPQVRVPVAARGALMRLTPLNVAGWALGGFYLSLMPSLVAAVIETRSPMLGAAVVTTLMLTATIAILIFRARAAESMLHTAGFALAAGIAVTLWGVEARSAPIMLAGTVIAGVGLGLTYFGSLRMLIPLAGERERAGLLSAYLVVSYVAFSVPAIAAGLMIPRLGLVTTAYVYGAALIVMSATSLILTSLLRTRKAARVA